MQIKVKPVAKRVQINVDLDVKGENYDDETEDAKLIEQLTLQSRPTNLTTSYALAYIR